MADEQENEPIDPAAVIEPGEADDDSALLTARELIVALNNNSTAIRSFKFRYKALAGVVAWLAVYGTLIGIGVVTNTNIASDSCRDDNEQNSNQHVLWEGIIALQPASTDPPKTEEEKRQDALQLVTFRALLDQTFPQKACAGNTFVSPILYGGLLGLTLISGVMAWYYWFYRPSNADKRKQAEEDDGTVLAT